MLPFLCNSGWVVFHFQKIEPTVSYKIKYVYLNDNYAKGGNEELLTKWMHCIAFKIYKYSSEVQLNN